MIRPFPLQLSTQCCQGSSSGSLSQFCLGQAGRSQRHRWKSGMARRIGRLEHLVRMYDRAQRYIFIAVYGLTSPLTVKALVEAKRRGVDVRVVTDRERLEDVKQQTALSTLCEAGIPIKINRHESLMHLKQAVIDDEINTNGSMNQTTSGNRYNDERLDIIRDHALTVKAREKFLSLWNDHERFQEWKK